MKTVNKTAVSRLLLVAGLLLALAVPAAAATDYSGSYGYVRVVEGSASLTQEGSDERASAEINQPVMAGDHLWVADRGHVEIVLADRNILRVDGGTELILERLAGSPDRDDQATVIRLLEGNVQLAVTEDSLGDELPRIDTENATIYVQNYGMFRVTAEREGWSQVVVRRGTAQVVTDGDRETVRADEEAVIENNDDRGDREARIDVRDAGSYDSLERWARRLDDEASSYQQAYVDDNLRYQASSLNRYGSWIDVEGSYYWRPVVTAGWRPYWHGRWVYTRAGLTWISTEPWGWVPYHYGTWDYLPAYGWLWRPGYVWSPAWVYWYWGPSYVGWCPTGYYTSFYGSHFGVSFGFRHGVYGWAGGDWGFFDHWNFVNAGYFRDGYYRQGYRDGRRDGHRDGYWDGRRDVERYAVRIDGQAHGRSLERGIITTDTKPLRPSTWQSEGTVLSALNVRPIGKEPPGRNGRETGREAVGVGGRDLPDVTQFVARKPQLPTEVVRTVGTQTPGASLDGTPLKPGTLGRSARGGEVGNGRTKPTWTRPGEVSGGKPGRVEIGGEKPARPTPGAEGGAPKPDRVAKPDRTDQSDRSDRSDSPGSTWSRPSRPAPEADGGAPRPRTGSEEKPARPEKPATAEERRPPADNAKPTWQRPAPESDGGAPKPERNREQAKPRAQEKPRDQEKPPVQEKPRTWEKPREQTPPPPERDRSQSWRSVERPDRPDRPDRPVDRPRQDDSVRPEPVRPQPERYSRPSNDRPTYQPPSRPEPRPERYSPPPQQRWEKPAQEARPSSPPPQNERSRGESSRPSRESKPRQRPPGA